jgi:O-Antigen ligase
MLALLIVVAAGLAWARRGGWPLTLAATGAAALFLALALVSTAWSVEPRLSFERAVALCLVFAAAALLAAAQVPERVLTGLVAGAVLVALAGILVLALDHRDAVSPASQQVPARYEGLGENPNTVPLLLALALPISVAGLLRSRRRLLTAATIAVLLPSLVASGSRGALVASAAGSVLAGLLMLRDLRARAAAVAVVAALAAVGAYIQSIPQPSAAAPQPAVHARAASASPAPPPPRYANADDRYPLDADVGAPLPGGGQPGVRRSFFGSSGRGAAWEGAIHQAAQRPLLGFGFGTEEDVFVDRYYYFVGSRPENAYIGLALQLGSIGLVSFLAILAAVGVAGARAAWGPRRPVAAAGLGVLAAGLVLGVVQSYPYSAGNIATLTLWSALFLLPAALRERPA